MRILAVRGRNLTSIEGTFELDLADGPLGDAGIFAITGPTGAGKSTILDAICVALYNRTPRFGGQPGVEVGRDGAMRGISSYDPRNLLRDGVGEGWAEVDFVGREGRKWRSRWTCWRARKRPEGPLQAAELTLEEIGGARVGGKLTETLAAIEERVGLDFDQFRRAVLLAQGDFAAFLRAKAPDRASLLEQMTGTSIYGEVSKRAFDRAAREAEALREVEARLADAEPLSAEARAALATEVEGVTTARAAAEVEARRVRAALAWHATADRLAADRVSALEEHAAATAARDALGAERALLAAVDGAEPARPAVEALDAAARAAGRAAEGAAEHAATAAKAAVAANEAAEALVTAEGGAAAADARLRAAAPALLEARALDARLRDATKLAETARATAETARRSAAEAEAARARLDAARAALDASLADLEAWLEKHARTGPVAEQWGAVRVHLTRLVEAAAQRARADAETPALETARDAARDAASSAHADRERRRLTAEAAATAAADARARADAAADPDRPLRRVVVNTRRGALAKCADLVASSARLGAEIAAEQAGIHAAQRGAREAGLAAEAARQAGGERTAALAEARDTLRRAQANLRDGEPCALCGATAHPWADGSPIADLLVDQAGRVDAIEAEVTALAAREARARADGDAAEHEADRARARLATRLDERAGLGRVWSDTRVDPLPPALPEPAAAAAPGPGLLFNAPAPDAAPPPFDPVPHAALAADVHTALGAADAALAELDDAERAAAEAARSARAADDARLAADTAHAAAVEAANAAERRREAAEQTLAAASQRRDAAAVEIDAALTAAAPVFGESATWRARADADPARFLAECDREVAEWDRRRTERATALAERATLDVTRAGAATVAAERASAELAARAEADSRARDADALRAARAALLGGAPADPFEEALTRDAAAHHAALESARRAAEAAAGARLAAAAAATAAAEESARRAFEHGSARTALDAALADLALDEATLRAHLARDRRWRDATRGRLGDADRAVAEAVARVSERTRACDAHAGTEAPADDRAACEAALPRAEAAQRDADELWSRARAALLQDDDRRERVKTLLPELEARRAVADRWRTLGRLIGSRDGNSFRKFAQSLTLNLLLVEANAQLASLNPRYQLQRVPHAEMELQVADLHMAEQVRPLTSLSGGETFLVSLALALGLASLASTRTRVESIFIDEGFGTLDADTLDVALSTLEALRAEGRTVGVISHVDGLAERLGTWVNVEKIGPGRSRVSIETA